MRQRTIAVWIVTLSLCVQCFAADPIEERASQLASALNIATNNHTSISNGAPVFFAEQTVKAGEFRVKRRMPKEPPLTALWDIEIFDENDQMVATGRVIERASSEMARKALLEKLVLNSMMIEALAQRYEVQRNDVGDLCIFERTFDATAKAYSSVPAAVHFVRGCTAVSVCSVARSKDIRDIAEAVDAVLLGSRAADRTHLEVPSSRMISPARPAQPRPAACTNAPVISE